MNKGLQKVLGDLELPDKERQLRVEIDKNLETTVNALLAAYPALLKPQQAGRSNMIDLDWKKINARVIGEFASKCILTYGQEEHTSKILTALIQYAYGVGYNNFDILAEKIPEDFGAGLIGEPGRLLEINLTGQLGAECFLGASYVAVTVLGNVGYGFAHGSKNSFFDISGFVGEDIGIYSEGCTFLVQSDEAYDKVRKSTKTHETWKSRVYCRPTGRDNRVHILTY
ncbi:MAG: hypothetical protein HY438_02855 [DPANN group archaeon]|nr:hypothetical protein [DPANN group archaeon]